MRYKDFVVTLYRSSVPSHVVDLGIDGDDIVTGVKLEEAAALERLVENYADAIDWLFQRASEANRDTFRDIVLRIPSHRSGPKFFDISKDPDL